MKQQYFPMFVSLTGRKAAVAGGGTVALRRIRTLLDFDCQVLVAAPEGREELEELERQEKIVWERRKFRQEDICGAFFVLAATDDGRANDEIAGWCRSAGVPVNHAGDLSQCDFYFPGIAGKGCVTVGVTASGRDHRLARKVTEAVRELLDRLCQEEKEEQE